MGKTAARESDSPHARNYSRAALGLIVLGAAFHLFYSTHLELVGDEAYYWLWSRHPDICYLDKGPMIAWLIWLGTALFGQTVFGVRFFAVLLAGGTGWAIFLLGRRLFSERAAFWAVVIASVVPLFAVGASLMTIDTVYIFFWSWAAVAFWQAKDQIRVAPWVGTGALVGLGLLSKYTAAIELLSFAAFCLWHRPSRVHFRRATFWSMTGTAVLFLVPAIIWNVHHHWPTSDWLLQRGALDTGVKIHPAFVFSFLGEQALVVSPLLFAGLFYVLWRRDELRPLQPALTYAAALFLPLFTLYLLLSFHYLGPPNWTAAAYVGGIVLLAAGWIELVATRVWARRVVVVALLLASLETGILLDTRWLHLPHRVDPLDRARGSRRLAAAVAQAKQKSGARFIIADNYMTAALLSFYLPGQPETFVPKVARPLNQLELWSDYDRKFPRGAALIVSKKRKVPRRLQRTFTSCRSLGPVKVVDGDRTVGEYHLFIAQRDPEINAPRSVPIALATRPAADARPGPQIAHPGRQ
ncbi:MAG: ArnT family glycosyltransferase [Chthoniobacterales bacterium]